MMLLRRCSMNPLLALGAAWIAASLAACSTTFANGKPTTFGDVQVGTVDILEPRVEDGVQQIGSITGQPVAGKKHFAMVAIPTPISSAQLELRDDAGRLLNSYRLHTWMPGQAGYESIYITDLIPPAAPFQLYVSGKSADGRTFRRDTGSRLRGQYVHLAAEPQRFACVGGPPFAYRLTLQNQGPEDRFEILVRDESGDVKSPLRQEISLDREQTHVLSVTAQVSPSSPLPATNELAYHSIYITVRSLTHPARETGLEMSATIPGPDEDGTLDDRCEPSKQEANN